MKESLAKFILGMLKDKYPMFTNVLVTEDTHSYSYEKPNYDVWLELKYSDFMKISQEEFDVLKEQIKGLGKYLGARIGGVYVYEPSTN